MKKNFKMAVAAMIVAVAGIGTYTQISEKPMSDIALANVEALAIGEYIVGMGWTCFLTLYDDVTSDTFAIVIRCSDCYSTSATSVRNPGYCHHH